MHTHLSDVFFCQIACTTIKVVTVGGRLGSSKGHTPWAQVQSRNSKTVWRELVRCCAMAASSSGVTGLALVMRRSFGLHAAKSGAIAARQLSAC